MSLRFETFIGPRIAPLITDLARLRITVFRGWPYLYDGDLNYERRYLAGYARSDTLLVAAFDGAEMVGASTSLDLLEQVGALGVDLARLPVPAETTRYFAESVLLPRYRGLGAGHVFFEKREAHARILGCTHATFCAVERPADHPARPPAHRPLDAFWRKRGYQRHEDVTARLAWRDIGAADKTLKRLTFWTKPL